MQHWLLTWTLCHGPSGELLAGEGITFFLQFVAYLSVFMPWLLKAGFVSWGLVGWLGSVLGCSCRRLSALVSVEWRFTAQRRPKQLLTAHRRPRCGSSKIKIGPPA